MEDVEKVYTGGTFGSEKCQSTPCSDLFLEVAMSKTCALGRVARFEVNSVKKSASEHSWKFTCRKSARHCGAKHVWK